MAELSTNPLFILAVLSLLVGIGEWLGERPYFRHLGSALLVIIGGAVVSNAGIIPANSTEAVPVPVYDAIFGTVAPIGLFWLLLSVNLRSVLKAGVPLIALFLVGALGTAAGALVGMKVVGGAETMGSLYRAVAGMFAGTSTGGSVNFNAVALEYQEMREPVLYGGAVVVDNIVTTVWIVLTLVIPRTLAAVWPRRVTDTVPRQSAAPITRLDAETERVNPAGVALVVALGAAAMVASGLLANAFTAAGFNVPSILIITTLALILAQVPVISSLAGARAIGMFAIYLFLAVIGAFCDVRALAELGSLGFVLLAFAAITVLVHGVVIFGVAAAAKMDLDAAAVASQANVGGSTSALALAKSLGREDLLVPGILLGALGNAIGTFLAFWVVSVA
jgi:uncharacterized membrane protein